MTENALYLIKAFILGVIEGLTEFIPVSSTGHLILVGDWINFQSSEGKVFEVVIQLGSILAVMWVFRARLLRLVRGTLTGVPSEVAFTRNLIIAFLPAAVIGALAHDFIKAVLFETPKLICVMLILGGAVLLWIDRLDLRPKYHEASQLPLSLCLKIGLFQCLAMIPGTSRSGATIVGSLLMGVDKRAAAEFSFFLAIPTMLGAFTLDLYKNRHVLSAADFPVIMVGFVAAFIMAVVVVRSLLGYVSRHGYSLFGWWRLAVGVVGLAALFVWG